MITSYDENLDKCGKRMPGRTIFWPRCRPDLRDAFGRESGRRGKPLHDGIVTLRAISFRFI